MEMDEWLWLGCYHRLRVMKLQPVVRESSEVGVPIGNSVTRHVLSRFPLTRGVLLIAIGVTRHGVCRLYMCEGQAGTNLFCIRFQFCK